MCGTRGIQAGHIPGATLIPMGELDKRLGELDAAKPTLVYCAVGGRSRVAAQMLAGNRFGEVYNMSGGIRAWSSGKAVGSDDVGLALFSGSETPAQVLVVAYGLEQGLRVFYLSLIPGLKNQEAVSLFQQLADIEITHQDRVLRLHEEVTGIKTTREEFERDTVSAAMEGGLSTEEYLRLYHPDFETLGDILSLAMAIEAQALDLYSRAAAEAGDAQARQILRQIADEEKSHIRRLGELLDRLHTDRT